MIETATVWAARLGSPDEGVKGSLVLWPDELAFTSEDAEVEIRIPMAELRRARRIHGSPVMVVEQTSGVVAFYFAQPPPMERGETIIERRRDRAGSLAYLGDTNAAMRKDIKRWTRSIKDAVKKAGR
ncbi:MAG: hypothetical protein ABR600_05735 [Actinomycetota bacterium]